MLLECQLTHQVWKMTKCCFFFCFCAELSGAFVRERATDALDKEWFLTDAWILQQRGSQVQRATTQQPEACSIRCWSYYFINIPTISETHPDDLVTDSDVNIEGFSIFRTDINQFIGEVVISAHNHYPAKAHYDFMRDNTEAVFVQVHSPRLKPVSERC